MNPGRFFSGLGLISVSLAIHGSLFFSLDRAVSINQSKLIEEQQKVLRQKEKNIQFEFVEAPPKALPQKPEESSKISDRDAVNQDGEKDKSGLKGTPNIQVQGVADQLAQHRGAVSQPSTPKSEPSEERKATPAAPPEKNENGQKESKEVSTPLPQKNVKESEAKPLINPSPGVQNLTGNDKITTQEMSKSKSKGAELFGVTSFEATGSGMGVYMKNLKEKIWLSWFPYLAFKYPMDFKSADAVISFTLNQKGEVKIVKMVESQGSPLFASICMDAIQRASGFGEVPKEMLALMGKDEIEIKFGFHYR